MLQARRRTFGALALLTAVAIGLTTTHLAAGWVIAPPAMILAGFLVLLREAALIDAERRRHGTQNHHSLAQAGADVTSAATGAPTAGQAAPAAMTAGTSPGRTTTSDQRAGQAPGTSGPGERVTAQDPELAGTYGQPAAMGQNGHVIDISGRLDGQFYDQYTDAVERAVGD